MKENENQYEVFSKGELIQYIREVKEVIKQLKTVTMKMNFIFSLD